MQTLWKGNFLDIYLIITKSIQIKFCKKQKAFLNAMILLKKKNTHTFVKMCWGIRVRKRWQYGVSFLASLLLYKGILSKKKTIPIKIQTDAINSKFFYNQFVFPSKSFKLEINFSCQSTGLIWFSKWSISH